MLCVLRMEQIVKKQTKGVAQQKDELFRRFFETFLNRSSNDAFQLIRLLCPGVRARCPGVGAPCLIRLPSLSRMPYQAPCVPRARSGSSL